MDHIYAQLSSPRSLYQLMGLSSILFLGFICKLWIGSYSKGRQFPVVGNPGRLDYRDAMNEGNEKVCRLF
jgi:hypothetical protein